MIYHFMCEFVHPFVRFQGVGIDRSASLDMFTNLSLERFLSAIRYDRRAYLARLAILAAFENTQNHCFVFTAGASNLDGANILVHVAGFLPDESFACFNLASQLVGRRDSERQPNPMIEKPRTLLGDVQRPRNLAA